MPQVPTPAASQTPSSRLGRDIAEAGAAGRRAEDMTLFLTLLDASKIKLDRGLPLEHVSFSPDGMRFMGVRVVQGGVSTSVLRRNEDIPAPPEPAQAPAKPAPRKRAPKAVA